MTKTSKSTDRASKRGRPSKYNPEYCDLIVAWGRQGLSITQMADKLGIGRQSMYDWKAKHAAFSYAYVLAREGAEAHYARVGRANMFSGSAFDQKAWIFLMAQRFPETYSWRRRERRRAEKRAARENSQKIVVVIDDRNAM